MLLNCAVNLMDNDAIFLCDAFDEDLLNNNSFEKWFNMFKSVIFTFSGGAICIIVVSVIIFVFMEIEYVSYNFLHGWRYVNFAKQLSDDQIVCILMLSVARDEKMLTNFNQGIKGFLNTLDLSKYVALGSTSSEIYGLVENLGNLNLFLYRGNDKLNGNEIYKKTQAVICAYIRSLSAIDFSRIFEYYYRSIGIVHGWYQNDKNPACDNHDSFRSSCTSCNRNKKIYNLCNKLKENQYFKSDANTIDVNDFIELLDNKYKLYTLLNNKKYEKMNRTTKEFVFDYMEYIYDEYINNTNKLEEVNIMSIIAKIELSKPKQQNAQNANSQLMANINSMLQPNVIQNNQEKYQKIQENKNEINILMGELVKSANIVSNHAQRDKNIDKFDSIDGLYCRLKFIKDLHSSKNDDFKDFILDDTNKDCVMDLLNLISGYNSLDKDGKNYKSYMSLRKYEFDENRSLNLKDSNVKKIYKSFQDTGVSKNAEKVFDLSLNLKKFINDKLLEVNGFTDDILNFYLRLSLYENRSLLGIDIDPDGLNNDNKTFVESLIKVFALSEKLMPVDSSKSIKGNMIAHNIMTMSNSNNTNNKKDNNTKKNKFTINNEIDKIFEKNLFTSSFTYFVENKFYKIVQKFINKFMEKLDSGNVVGEPLDDDDSIAWKRLIFSFSDSMNVIHVPLFLYDLLFVITLFIVPYIVHKFYDFQKISLESVKLMNKDLLSVKSNILIDLELNLSGFVYSSYIIFSFSCAFIIVLFRSIVHYEISGYGFGDLLSRLAPIATCILLLIFDGNSLDYVHSDDIMNDLSDKLRLIQEYYVPLNRQINTTIAKSEYNIWYILFFAISIVISVFTEYMNLSKIDNFAFILDCRLETEVEYCNRFKKLSSIFLSKEFPKDMKDVSMYFMMLGFLVIWTFIFLVIYMMSRGFKRSTHYLLSSFEFFSSIIRSRQEIEDLKMIDDFREVHLKVDKYVIFRVDARKYDKAFFYKLNSLMLSANFEGMIDHINTLSDYKLRDELLKLANNPDNILLKNINFKIIAGHVIAYVNGYQYTIPTGICELHGISGSGKSTILKKLIGFQNT